MKIGILFSLSLIVCSMVAFEDKPALTTAERAVLAGGKVAGTAVGLFTATAAGATAASELSRSSIQSPLSRGNTEAALSGAIVGTGALGGYAGNKAGEYLGIKALAKYHSVSAKVEATSIYYNINISQYRPILLAAEAKDAKLLLEAINELFPNRFGVQWKANFSTLFNKYKRSINIILATPVKELSNDKKEFIRYLELGAAMACLFYNTNPKKDDMFSLARKMYEELGIL